MAGRYTGTGQRAGLEREGRAIIVAYTQGLLRRRIVRYALVGGLGIPVNLLALALFLHLMGDRLYPLASACAFEVSTTVNFVWTPQWGPDRISPEGREKLGIEI